MKNAEHFINWLEGYLDASKNKLDSSQVREIRKKISSYRTESVNTIIPLYSGTTYSTNSTLNEEFIKEIDKNKNASTMEALETN